MLTVWVPEALVRLIDEGVELTDTDRSKFVRAAIREKARRHGVEIEVSA